MISVCISIHLLKYGCHITKNGCIQKGCKKRRKTIDIMHNKLWSSVCVPLRCKTGNCQAHRNSCNISALLGRPDGHKHFIGHLQHYKLRTTTYCCDGESCNTTICHRPSNNSVVSKPLQSHNRRHKNFQTNSWTANTLKFHLWFIEPVLKCHQWQISKL